MKLYWLLLQGMVRIPHGLKLENLGQLIHFLMIFLLSKITKKMSWLVQSALWWNLFNIYIYTGAFCVWVKVLNRITKAQNWPTALYIVKISSTIRVHNQSDTNFFSNISFILSGTIVRLHTNKGNMFVNKYATFREYSLHSYFLRDFCFKKLIKNMAVTRNIYTDGMLFDNKYLDQSAPY